MAKLRELIIKISANSSSYQSEIAKAARLGESYHRVMEGGNRRSAAAVRGSSAALRDLNNQLVSVKASAIGLTGAFAGIFATNKLVETADKWTNLNARLKLATSSSVDLANSQRLLMEMSQKTGTSFEANATVFARAAAPMRALKYASQDIVNMTEVLSTGLRISGASASESSSVLVQFSQAMSSGVLRGEEFNAMAENGSRIIQALADGMGVARTKLKGMADNGLLTMEKVIPALLSQLEKLKTEGGSMGATVEKSLTRVQNAFMQWVGGANEATGTTRVLAGTLDYLSKNINDVAAAGMVVAGLFGAKALGNRTLAIHASTSALIQNTKAEINNANQAYHNSRIQVENARATERQAQRHVLAARSALLHTTNAQQFAAAQSRLNRAIEAQAKAHAVVAQSIAARTAAQSRLNAVTSLGRRMGGALLGAVGGLPGVLVMASAAAYMLYQNQRQAKEEALAYANTIDTIKDKLGALSLIQLDDETKKIKNAIGAVRDELDALKTDLKVKESQLNDAKFLANSSGQAARWGQSPTYFKSTAAGTERAILVLKEKINEREAKSIELNEALVALQEKFRSKVDETLIASKNSQYSTERIVAEFNKVPSIAEKTNNALSFGTSKLDDAAARALAFANNMGAVSSNTMAAVNRINLLISAMKAPELSASQSSMMDKQVDRLELSKYTGREKQQKQLELDAKNNNLPAPYADSYIRMGMQSYDNEEAARKRESEAKEARNAAESAARKAAKAVEDYTNKVAELNTQLTTEAIRYKEGNAAAELFAASMASGKNFTKEQNDEIGRLNKTLGEAKQRYQDLQAAIEADPFRHVAKRTQEATEQLQRQKANGQIESPAEYTYRKSEIWKDEVRGKAEASQQYAVSAKNDLLGDVDPIQDIENQLERKKALYQAYADEDVITQQRKGELILAAERDTDSKRIEAAKQVFASQGELQSLAVTMFETTQERMGNMITGLLTGSKSLREGMSELFASLAQDVVKSLIKMAAQALITSTIMKGMESMGGGGGMFSGFASMFTKNAKGGVYQSANLSQYSGQIVSSPTMFAFAKGAGLMGEAGPEAIMPLDRMSDGNLGVRAITPKGLGGKDNTNINVYITDGKTESSSTSGDNEAFGRRFAQAVAQVYYAERDRDLRQGGAINKVIRGR
ncbi:tape measure protein [Xenorhabdus ehlersii]|uniref:Lambda family phage tail tape measure protein n=1 Tax=Xenorhabdus ehlersii TaxID=290111 RepID=A0A2D0IKJ2_9GAMM|nr:tape measure protein [Xenorhabdus ehlersii]PHM22297.1 tail component [Xenorhabdus ehlersii]RKE87869.1 lambda family phage tail tape measure protein [Xenorhabdus ehlersii]